MTTLLEARGVSKHFPIGHGRIVHAVDDVSLAIAERAGQPFSAGIAHQLLAASCRRSLRLEQGTAHADAAIRIFRELGARWELASSLGDRGAIHRVRVGHSRLAAIRVREAIACVDEMAARGEFFDDFTALDGEHVAHPIQGA